MSEINLSHIYQTVCNAPGGNGFRVEHIPELFATSDIDDCMAHVHSFYEILWFQDGEGIHTVDFVDYKVVPGTIFFLSPGQIHHFDCKDNYRGVAIKMCTDLIKVSNSSTNISRLFLEYNAFHTYEGTPYYIIDEPTSKLLQPLIHEMELEAERNGELGNIDILKSLLTIFLAKIERYGKHETELTVDYRKPSHLLFIRFRQLLEQEYKQLHTVQEYANRLNVSVRSLSNSVNECSGKSPLIFINNRIILEAKRLVLYSDLMIKEIAYMLGYDDPSYFVKHFKRHTGYLPSEFREMER